MNATLSQGSVADRGAATWRGFPDQRPDSIALPPAPRIVERTTGFAESGGPNWMAIATIVAVHVLLLYALVKLDVISISKPKPKALVVDLLKLPDDPPPVAPPEQKVAPPEPVAPTIVVPRPVVITPAPAPTLVVTRDPPPPRAVIVAPAAPAAPAGPVSIDDLSSTMIGAPPPSYPMESRRRKEQGTVFLSVLIGTDGRVSEVGISRTSGSERLDKAALAAVRRWRWSPLIRSGAAVMVRGIVDVQFTL
jgi:protein TonB